MAEAPAGTITGAVRGRLTLAASPYVVTGDLRLLAGDSLLIEPGVELRFSASSSFVVEGRLIAHGTEEDSISFTSSALPAALPGDWNGIFLYGGGSAPLSRAVIAHAATGITCAGGAPVLERNTIRRNINGIDCLESARPQIRDNLFVANANAAIRCINSAPTLRANVITRNARGGFESAVVCNGASPIIVLNLIYANGNSGIDCANGAAPRIHQNTLAGNDFGITISDSDPLLHNNLITGSTTGISCENAAPDIRFNDVYGNTQGDFFNCPPGAGILTTANFNNDSCDVFANISANPLYVNPAAGDYRIREGSPCINAGDPANLAGIVIFGARPDIGYHEFNEPVLSVELAYFAAENGELVWQVGGESATTGFEVQRASRGEGPFATIGFVPVRASQRYCYRDQVATGVWYYRLSQVGADGVSRLSAVLRVDYARTQRPATGGLAPNYPNPFNPSTTIAYEISGAGERAVRLLICNSAGQVVRELTNRRQSPGRYEIVWQADDALDRPVAAGVYFCRLEVDKEIHTRRMVLLR